MTQIAADTGRLGARNAENARMQHARAGQDGNIVLLPLYGIVTQRGNQVNQVSGPGSTSTQKFSAAMRQAMQDPSVDAVLIDIDSPGGSVYGIDELAAEIIKNRSTKLIVGLANSLAASAAYWVGAACSELYVTPGGEVGSIGVWQAHEDISVALEDAGVKTTLISAGKFKTEGNPYQPLDGDAKAFMQQRVDEYYGAFTRRVAQGRGVSVDVVRRDFGQGRVYGASQALAAGMVNGVMTLDQVVAKMSRNLLLSNSNRAGIGGSSGQSTPRLASAQRTLAIHGIDRSTPAGANADRANVSALATGRR